MKPKLLLLTLALSCAAAQAQYRSQVWSPDNGDGTYTNPVINADYSDPDVCVGASGTDFYLTASSFNHLPGLPILHSKDLVNWTMWVMRSSRLNRKRCSTSPRTAWECGHRA